MKDQIKWVLNTMPKSDDRQLPIMSLSNVAKARFFHSTFPQYSVTPLDRLDGMAQYLGLAGLCVKNESFRFGLNAFKVLGGSFAMAKYIAKEMGRDVSEMTYDYLTSEAFRKEFGQATFFTATDGNHGRGVAWAANKLGQKAVVHMPKGSSKPRYDNIAKEGAAVTIEEVNYDDCVRMAAAEAAPSKADFDARYLYLRACTNTREVSRSLQNLAKLARDHVANRHRVGSNEITNDIGTLVADIRTLVNAREDHADVTALRNRAADVITRIEDLQRRLMEAQPRGSMTIRCCEFHLSYLLVLRELVNHYEIASLLEEQIDALARGAKAA